MKQPGNVKKLEIPQVTNKITPQNKIPEWFVDYLCTLPPSESSKGKISNGVKSHSLGGQFISLRHQITLR